jgi:hypothetical protein
VNETPEPQSSTLSYWVGQELDVLHLRDLADTWHSLGCQSMPGGTTIKSITYQGSGPRSGVLVVTFE